MCQQSEKCDVPCSQLDTSVFACVSCIRPSRTQKQCPFIDITDGQQKTHHFQPKTAPTPVLAAWWVLFHSCSVRWHAACKMQANDKEHTTDNDDNNKATQQPMTSKTQQPTVSHGEGEGKAIFDGRAVVTVRARERTKSFWIIKSTFTTRMIDKQCWEMTTTMTAIDDDDENGRMPLVMLLREM